MLHPSDESALGHAAIPDMFCFESVSQLCFLCFDNSVVERLYKRDVRYTSFASRYVIALHWQS